MVSSESARGVWPSSRYESSGGDIEDRQGGAAGSSLSAGDSPRGGPRELEMVRPSSRGIPLLEDNSGPPLEESSMLHEEPMDNSPTHGASSALQENDMGPQPIPSNPEVFR